MAQKRKISMFCIRLRYSRLWRACLHGATLRAGRDMLPHQHLPTTWLQVSRSDAQAMGCCHGHLSASSIMWSRHATADALLRGLLKFSRELAYWPQISLGQNILCSARTQSAVLSALLQCHQVTAPT